MVSAIGPGSQHNHIPAAVLQLHDIRMPRIGNSRSHTQMPVGHDGVAVISFVFPHHLPAPGYRHRMEVLGAAFGYHQIIPAVLFV